MCKHFLNAKENQNKEKENRKKSKTNDIHWDKKIVKTTEKNTVLAGEHCGLS